MSRSRWWFPLHVSVPLCREALPPAWVNFHTALDDDLSFKDVWMEPLFIIRALVFIYSSVLQKKENMKAFQLRFLMTSSSIRVSACLHMSVSHSLLVHLSASLSVFYMYGQVVNASFCFAGCISLLGMEGGGIAESQITSSSVYYGMLGLQRWGPELARLNNKGLVNAWTSATHDKNPWIEVQRMRIGYVIDISLILFMLTFVQ